MNKSNSITLYEYEKSEELTQREISLIKKLNKNFFSSKDEDSGFFDLISGNRIKSKQFVGFISLKSKTIQVLPKLLKNSQENTDSSIIKNLLFMLSFTKKLGIKETDISKLGDSENLYEIIIYLFAKNLLELLKKEIYRTYETREENLNYLKGKLLITDQIKKNQFDKTKFYVSHDELIENNLLNQVFKTTITKLINFTKSNKNFKLLTECDLILDNVSNKNLKLIDCEKLNFNRLNKNYENSFNLAKLLLFGNSTSFESSNLDSYSFMFDMNKLFEEFIGEFIKRYFGEHYKEIYLQKSNKYVFAKEYNDKNYFNLKPDIYFKKFDGKALIIDTKYKILNENKSYSGVQQGDIYQMFMYGLRYFNNENVKKIILLYPQETNHNYELENSYISEENINIAIKSINLHFNLISNKENLISQLKEVLEI